MTHTEQLELVKAVRDLLPHIEHTRWPSGRCTTENNGGVCSGCALAGVVHRLLTAVEQSLPAEARQDILRDVQNAKVMLTSSHVLDNKHRLGVLGDQDVGAAIASLNSAQVRLLSYPGSDLEGEISKEAP